MSFTQEQVRAALKGVKDPDLGQDLVDLGMIKDIRVEGRNVALTVELTTPACPLKDKIQSDVRAALQANLKPDSVTVNMSANTSRLQQTATELIPGVRNVVLVGSGKGGVGKSTVAANLAVSLAKSGAAVGLLDADIYGPSVPTMFDVHVSPEATDDERIVPHRKHGLRLMSMGFLLQEGQPVIWRGPMLDSVMRQFLGQVEWGELDYLVVDLPPGTGDVQLSLSRMVPNAVAVVVTTPQDVALADVQRAIGMFNSVHLHVLGVVENMSGFVCSHCGTRTEIFGSGAAKKAAEKYGIARLGEIPLTEEVVTSGDGGEPIVLAKPQNASAVALAAFSARVAQQIAIHASAAQTAAV
ncbi:MAG: Mrp/NBP35 family ATP-binding protein [Planctomycetes bacterium]|nr:Mrp/NBP35 family ATP-binding protein [Planctomycetota bacterium]